MDSWQNKFKKTKFEIDLIELASYANDHLISRPLTEDGAKLKGQVLGAFLRAYVKNEI